MSRAAPAEVLEFHLALPLDAFETAETPEDRRTAAIGIARGCDGVQRSGYTLPPKIAEALKQANLARFRPRARFEGPRPGQPGDRGADAALMRLASLVAALFD